MSTIGLYFSGSQKAANALRAHLNEQFGRLGYATETSANTSRERRKPWSGGLPKGLMALDRGELAVVPVPAPDVVEAIARYLRGEGVAYHDDSMPISRNLLAYADALEQAVKRQESVVKEDTGATPQS